MGPEQVGGGARWSGGWDMAKREIETDEEQQ